MPEQFDFITLGETMVRLSPPGFQRIAQTQSFDFQIGGAESNTAINLAWLGFKTAWLSRMPDNALGHKVVSVIASYGVDTSGVRFVPGERVGVYFIELATPPRPNRVIYDRAGSAASRMTTADVDFDRIQRSAWLHMTGITPALSASCLAMTAEVLRFAREHGLVVSFDVNYRALLWSPQEAGRALEPLMSLCNYVFVAHRDAIALFGAPESPQQAAATLQQRFGCDTLVMTLGEAGAIAQTRSQQVEVPQTFKAPQIVDRIGAGDAFDAGFMAAQRWGLSLETSLRYGNALSALKLTIPGDLALFSKEEVDQLIGGSTQASVR
ncbi:MAG: sugar kinase [Thermoflexales bacterium]|nr:sugar kinase [Thermoflexales bacterium]MDW8352284.1 sugar kinase [Anaerolineae bacterium]